MFSRYQALIDRPSAPGRRQADQLRDPVAIGAVGGSGTRLVRSILLEAGVAMSAGINDAGDAVDWPPLRELLAHRGSVSREDMLGAAFVVMEEMLLERRSRLGHEGRIGWKVPGTFLWLRELNDYFPEMQYVHLMRNGLDMAYSGNRSQARDWASQFDIELELDSTGRITPSCTLEYWLRANAFALGETRDSMGERFLLLRYEDLCSDPATEVRKVTEFVGISLPDDHLAGISELVRRPGSIDRYQTRDWITDFTEDQLQRLELFGYRVDS